MSELSNNSDPLFDAVRAARYLGLDGVVNHPAQAVRSLARKRKIRSTKVAGKIMIRQSWLEAYIQANTREVPA